MSFNKVFAGLASTGLIFSVYMVAAERTEIKKDTEISQIKIIKSCFAEFNIIC